jgi:hypothetical protein
MQGKYINDPEVLLAAAEAAGVKDAQQVLQEPSLAKDEVLLLALFLYPRIRCPLFCRLRFAPFAVDVSGLVSLVG